MAKNKIAPRSATEIELQTKVFKWNFDKSVSKIKPKVQKWMTLTTEIAEELYIAREYLNGQIGQRKDPLADNYIEFTWADYCEAVGISKRIANDWLKAYIPAERSETGEAYLMSPEEIKAVNAEKAKLAFEKSEIRVAKFLKTGIRPDGWTRADEAEVTLRQAAARTKEVIDLWQKNNLKVEPRRDYFSEIASRSGDLKKYAFENPNHNAIQLKVFDSIDEYLRSFDDLNNRLIAAYNLSVKLKEMVNYYAELDIQAIEAKAAEQSTNGIEEV